MKRIILLFIAATITAVALFSLTVSAANEYNLNVGTKNTDDLRQDCSFYLGVTFRTGATPIKVTQLGRYKINGNAGTHTVAIFDLSDMSAPLCSASVDVSSVADNTFAYGEVDKQVVLSPNTKYAIYSMEEANGDFWYNSFRNVSERPYDIFFVNWTYYFNDGNAPTMGDESVDTSGCGFVGLDIKYTYPSNENTTSNPELFAIKNPSNGLRHDCSFYLGGMITVGDKDIVVTDIGRMCWEGNQMPHNLYIADASSKKIIASAVVDMNGKTAGGYVYAKLDKAVTLEAGKSYYLMSYEHYDGDNWAEASFDSKAEGNTYVSFANWAYLLPGETEYAGDPNGGEYSYVGLNLKYQDPESGASVPTSDMIGLAAVIVSLAAVPVIIIARSKKHEN